MTRKLREISFALLLLLISAVFAYEVKSGILFRDNIHLHPDSDNSTDLELPHQQKHYVSDDEKILILSSFDLSSDAVTATSIQYLNDLKPIDFSVMIWQPPRLM